MAKRYRAHTGAAGSRPLVDEAEDASGFLPVRHNRVPTWQGGLATALAAESPLDAEGIPRFVRSVLDDSALYPHAVLKRCHRARIVARIRAMQRETMATSVPVVFNGARFEPSLVPAVIDPAALRLDDFTALVVHGPIQRREMVQAGTRGERKAVRVLAEGQAVHYDRPDTRLKASEKAALRKAKRNAK